MNKVWHIHKRNATQEQERMNCWYIPYELQKQCANWRNQMHGLEYFMIPLIKFPENAKLLEKNGDYYLPGAQSTILYYKDINSSHTVE